MGKVTEGVRRGRASSSDSQRVLAAKLDRHAGQRRRRRPAKLVNGLRRGVDDGGGRSRRPRSWLWKSLRPAGQTTRPGLGETRRGGTRTVLTARAPTPNAATRDVAPGPSPHPTSRSRPCAADQAPSDAPRQAQRAVPVTCGVAAALISANSLADEASSGHPALHARLLRQLGVQPAGQLHE